MYTKLPIKNIINITKLITVYYFEMTPKYKAKGELHDFWELVYVDNGEIDAINGDKRFHLKRGEMVLHLPNEYHSVECDGIHSANVFIVTFECNSYAIKRFRQHIIGTTPEIREILTGLINESVKSVNVGITPLRALEDAPFGGSQMLKIYLEMLMIMLIRSDNGSPKNEKLFAVRQITDDTLVSDICEYLENNVYSYISLDEICTNFHFGKSYLCAAFRRYTGDTIIHYYNSLKIREAKRLLTEREISIAEVAEKLNYDTSQYFSRIFKKHAGITPHEYKNLVAKRAIVNVTVTKKT